MLKSALSIAASVAAFALAADAPSSAQNSSGFEKRNFNYNEWTKGKFSEVVTVTNPGKIIFLAGIGPEREGDGKIVHEDNFMEQCRYAYMKIKKLLDLQGATMNDVVRIMTYDGCPVLPGRLEMSRRGFRDRPDPCVHVSGCESIGMAAHGDRSRCDRHARQISTIRRVLLPGRSEGKPVPSLDPGRTAAFAYT
jgi:enamine deaminase RidA (YjgF/YER057c/UK114 family)